MDYAAIYHWWSEDATKNPYNFMRSPVILSIATLRYHNKNLPIYVIDASRHPWKPKDWGHFPEKLNFTIKRMSHRFPLPWGPFVDERLCSRTWDVEYLGSLLPQNRIIAIDSDIFWLKSIFPLNGEKDGIITKFSSGTNCGVYYYDKRTIGSFFEFWKGLTVLACIDEHFREELIECLGIRQWGHPEHIFDERVLNYIIKKTPDLVFDIGQSENYILSGIIADDKQKIQNMKNVHCLGCICNCWRGWACLLFEELSTIISTIFSEEEIKMIFEDFVPPKKFSLFNMNRHKAKQFLEIVGMDPWQPHLLGPLRI